MKRIEIIRGDITRIQVDAPPTVRCWAAVVSEPSIAPAGRLFWQNVSKSGRGRADAEQARR